MAPNEIEDAVKSAIPEMIEQIKNGIVVSAKAKAQEVANQMVVEAVREWMKANFIPEINSQLAVGKDGMIKLAQFVAKGITEMLAENILAKATKTISSSSSLSKDLMEKILRGY